MLCAKFHELLSRKAFLPQTPINAAGRGWQVISDSDLELL